ncbi:sugar phosphate isomerase/epimerase [Ideonella azotifigens]|uniref:Xylose isomerase-like TIM barrel domain-containing protein n=1 Tax=Ideonella azotifigens TaxID=513160 RepID=A0ABN1JYQ9_9BURK|nr:sugar phosphate isomerase/epimerase family protein [Ideonella azotifigens]MCD2341500.1 sugar phosphate isomerase/epimerase [Ideonella azotifigens]
MSSTLRPAAFAVNTYSYTLGSSVRDCLERLARRGFRAFELMMYPGHLWPAHADAAARRELRAFVETNGLRITTLNMPNIDLNVAAATEEMRRSTLAVLQSVVVLAGDLGAEGVVIGPGKANPLLAMPRDALVGHFHQALAQLVPLAADLGTAVHVENMPFAFLPHMAGLLEAVDQFADDRVGIVYDLANGHFVGEDLCEALRLCARRLRVVHLSDTGRSVYRHDAVGLGTVDFRPVPATLEAIGFRCPPVLEIIDPEPDAAIERSVLALQGMGWAPAVAAAR